MDPMTKDERSKQMEKVRSSGNKSTELKLISIFKELHITGWRRHYDGKGHPDFIFLNQKIALFVDGCFWHGHECRHSPKSNVDYWEKKRAYNISHDKEITKQFENRGWRVIRVWECELRKKNREQLLKKLSIINYTNESQ